MGNLACHAILCKSSLLRAYSRANKGKQTPTAHSLQAYGIQVSGSFALSSWRSSFPCGGRVAPKLSRIPAFETLSRKCLTT